MAPKPLHPYFQRYDVVLKDVREGVDRFILGSNGVDSFPSCVIGELADVR